jgi:hypothetical protein
MTDAAAVNAAERFAGLATAAAELLQDADDPALIANPYLHPRNVHPANLTLYRPLIEGRGEPWTDPGNWLAALRAVGMALRDQGAAWHGDDVVAPLDILFVSHFLRPEQAESGQDLYYGNLPTELERQGLRCAVAMLNHTGLHWASIAPLWKQQTQCRLLLARTLHAKCEIRNGFALARAARRLRQLGTGNEIAARAAAHAGSGTALSSMRIGRQIAELARYAKARVLVMTYEGHGWERLAMMLSRQAMPGIICVGYSHAVLFPQPRAMTTSLGETLDPDFILTAGSATRDKLAGLLHMPKVRLDVLGSVRRGTAALSPDRPPRCLVLPEGLKSESVPLICAAAEAARLLPDVTFRVRLHPVIERHNLLAEVPMLRNLPRNVEWSQQGGLEADFADSRWLLYRGTSAVFQGVEAGLRPYYLAQPGEFVSIDPLADLHAWKVDVGSGADLAEALSRPADAAVDRVDLATARHYCSAYFTPMSGGTLIDIAGRAHAPDKDSGLA